MALTAVQKLAEFGVTIEEAHAFVMANIGQLGLILQVAQAKGITNAMLGEIAGWPMDPIPGDVVKAYCAAQGFDTTALDGGGSGSTGIVTLVGDPTFDEGTDLIYLVMLASATTGTTNLSFSVVGGTAEAADFGTPTFTEGVTLSGDHLVVPAGVSSFSVLVPTVNDTLREAFETVLVTVDGVTGTGYIADNDPNGAVPVQLVGVTES